MESNRSLRAAEGLYAALEAEDVSPFVELCADDVMVVYPADFDTAAATDAR